MLKAFPLQICNRSQASVQFCQLNLLRDQFTHVAASVTMFILRQWPKERDLCWIFTTVLFVIYAALTWGPFPRLPTKEQQPQGLSVNTIQLGCSGVLSTNWKLRKNCKFTQTFCVYSLYLDASVILPVSHRLLEQGFVDAATSEQKVTSEISRCYQWFGPRSDANFTKLLRTDHHITQQTLSNNPNTNALSWLQILQCSTSLYTPK